jgi:hypothetical protein
MVLIFISMNNRPQKNRLMDQSKSCLELKENSSLEEKPLLKENTYIQYPSSDNVSDNENQSTTGVSNSFSGKCLISISIM